ncbi:MAG: hypothetical protein RJA81_960 [Planctomycetota bacterium]
MNKTVPPQPSSMVIICLSLAMTLLVGCRSSEPVNAIPKLKPVTGKVSLNGKPLEGVIVTFLPKEEGGSMTVGETDENGQYKLSYVGMPGCASGPYQVMLSYKTTADGKPVTLAMQSALIMPKEAAGAVELMPEKYMGGKSTLTAEVPAEGGQIDFSLEGELLPLPDPNSSAPEKTEAKDN